MKTRLIQARNDKVIFFLPRDTAVLEFSVSPITVFRNSSTWRKILIIANEITANFYSQVVPFQQFY